jgi:Dehydrogenases with different specificities (related to short-chain alcohol dehydrogenases)
MSMQTSNRLEGQAAIVTGASQGVGKGIALKLARAGCRVAVNYHSSPGLAEETVAGITALGGEALMVKADVSVASDVRDMFERAVARFGRVNTVVNNAGIQTWTAFLDVTESEWDRVIDTNLKGCFLCSQAAGRHMKDQGGGSIVNIGSGCNKVPFPRLVAYTASKGGIEMLTKVAAVELGPHRIRVNCVAPGAIEIERTRRESADYAATWGRVTPLRRIGTPDDVGEAVVFLASAESSFVTGQTIWVDGGLFTQGPWPDDEGR